jgi:hypothetical protein
VTDSPKPTALDVAQWMLAEFEGQGDYLAQADAIASIEDRFGDQFVRESDDGTRGIARAVLAEFRTLTPDVVWDRSELAWRRRVDSDQDGRRSE